MTLNLRESRRFSIKFAKIINSILYIYKKNAESEGGAFELKPEITFAAFDAARSKAFFESSAANAVASFASEPAPAEAKHS